MIYRRSMTEHVSGDDARLPQRRHLVTEIPGPVSRELLARRERAVARGVSHVLPVFVTDSGAEAVENAVKIARHATGRQAVVAFDHAYHGRTNLTMALTAKNMPYKDKFGPFAGEIYRMPMAYPLRWPGGREACATDALPM